MTPTSISPGLLIRFGRDRRASLALWFAVALVPILYGLGAALDYGRSVNFKQQLQDAADSAALAGAGVYTTGSAAAAATTVAQTYMNNFATSMGAAANIAYTVSLSSAASGSTTTVYAVTVAATGTVANSIMAGFNSATTHVSVRAKAQNPVYTLTLKLSSFASSAADADSLFYYVVPADGSAPAASATTQFFTNNGVNTATQFTIQLTANQKLGFMLKNITGGRVLYPLNGYGGLYGSYHYFYSHLFPPSATAYPAVTKNCNLQVIAGSGAATKGSCFTSNSPNAAINCASAGGSTWTYHWNDMGGLVDDDDYDDIVYTVTCSQNDSTLNAGVVLVQ
jgi:Flp pilus assembly protein TadG